MPEAALSFSPKMLDPFACSLDPVSALKGPAKTQRHDAKKGNRKRRLASATSRSHYRRAVAELSRYGKLIIGAQLDE
jgi:hypothetical protein